MSLRPAVQNTFILGKSNNNSGSVTPHLLMPWTGKVMLNIVVDATDWFFCEIFKMWAYSIFNLFILQEKIRGNKI